MEKQLMTVNIFLGPAGNAKSHNLLHRQERF